MFYSCSENKGADQLHGYREADLRLCFRICKKPVFQRCGSYKKSMVNMESKLWFSAITNWSHVMILHVRTTMAQIS